MCSDISMVNVLRRISKHFSLGVLFILYFPVMAIKEYWDETDYVLRMRGKLLRMYYRVRGRANISIGEGFLLGHGSKLHIHSSGKCVIGSNVIIKNLVYIRVGDKASLEIKDGVSINDFTRISSFEYIEIGEKAQIASSVNILDHDHRFDLQNDVCVGEYETSPIRIGKGVWIGAKVGIGKGVILGDYSVIGMNAVVKDNVPARSLAVGVPARIIKKVEDGPQVVG